MNLGNGSSRTMILRCYPMLDRLGGALKTIMLASTSL